jgi:Ca2+-binding RTX toxin-like protein
MSLPRRSILRALELESRTAPAVLSYTAPAGNGADLLVLSLNSTGSRILLTDNGVQVASRTVGSLSAIEISGALNENDTLVVNYSAGVFNIPITYNGGAGGVDSLEVMGTNTSSAVYDPSATTSGSGAVAVGAATIQFSDLSPVIISRMASLTMTTPNGADLLTVDAPSAGRTRISGTSGGIAFESLTFFDVGNVTLKAGTNGAAGNDAITVTGPVAATGLLSFSVHVGAGVNSMDFSTSPQAITATIGTDSTTVVFSGGGVPVSVRGTVSTFTGTSFDDTYIDQTAISALFLFDGGGNNQFELDPSSSIDITATGGGNNTINFSDSPDPIVATIGTTTTTVSEVGDDGTVTFTGSEGTYVGTIIGTTGDDTYIDQTTIETLFIIDVGGNNYAVLDPSSTIDITATGGGSNTIDFSTSGDPVVANVGATITTVEEVGDDGSVIFTGSEGSYVGAVIGTSGDDTFIDSTTNDQLWDGGAGDDIFDAQPSSSITIIEDSSGGTDTLRLDRAFFAVDANLQAGIVIDANGNQVFVVDRQGNLSASIENMSGTAFSDVIRGTDGDNVLFGVGGNDIFDGGAGNDIFIPVLGGSVAIFDAAGNDTIDYSAASRGINLDLSRSNGSMQTIDSVGSTLALFGEIENAVGTSHDDSITGGSANNILVGQDGNDRLLGQSGHDVLIGGAGDDEINGGSDRDIAVGGRGADRLNAGSGQDILIAGFTVYDTAGSLDQVDFDAWTAIRAAWITANPVGELIAAIRTGVGPQGQYRLNSTGADATVENDDGAADVLTGGQAADWFFVLLPPDVITDNDDQEFIN